jgi:uncharacterized protein YecE (DUF72 family)
MIFKIPARFSPDLKIGTCSWKYDSWKGLIYEAGKTYRSDDYLSDYARVLDSVEVDQWFWSLFPGTVRLPESGQVRRYAESVPDNFVFTVKAPNALTLTHFYSKQPAAYAAYAGRPNDFFLDNGLLERFLEHLAPLGNKLGPVLFQFEYLNKSKMPGQEAFIERFGAFISRAPKDFRYAVETRNPNFLSAAFFEFLARNRVGFVYLEGYYMPPIGQVFETHHPPTADFAVIRLHGGGRREIEKETGEVWNRIVSPRLDGIRAAARIVRSNAGRGVTTFVNVNNHFEGSAPLSIQRFLEELGTGEDDFGHP